MDTAAIAAAFFDAIERGDLPAVRKLYAGHALVWHNTDNAQQTVDENLALLGAFIGRTVSRAYVDRRLQLFAGGLCSSIDCAQQSRMAALSSCMPQSSARWTRGISSAWTSIWTPRLSRASGIEQTSSAWTRSHALTEPGR